MLTSHPSPDAFDRYRRGLLSPEELLAVDDHLAGCASCREAASRGAAGMPPGAMEVRSLDVLLAAPAPLEHPEYEELAAYVDGVQDDVAREVTEVHLADCATCRDEVADLRAFKARQPAAPLTLAASSQAGRENSSPLPHSGRAAGAGAEAGAGMKGLRPWLVLAALPAAAIVVWMLMPRSAVREITTPPVDRPVARVDPPPSLPPTLPPAAATVASLRDGGGVIALDAAGQVTGLPSSLPQPERTMLVAALSTGRMTLPGLIREIAAEGEVLRGSGGGSGSASGGALPFTLREPIGTAVESDRPRFRWDRFPAARAYVVSIYDEDFARVAQSPELTSSTEWTSDRALPRGKTYTWRVSALTAPAGASSAAPASTPAAATPSATSSSSGTITVPAAPAPPARFVVLTRSQADELARARQAYPDGHLLLAAAYARAGVRDAAERELRALQRDNPDAAIIRTLLASLR